MSDTNLDPEVAAYAALEKEYGDEPAAPVAQPEQDKTEAKAEPELPAAEKKAEDQKPADRLPYEELEKRHKNLNGALAEERANNRALRERQQQFEQVLNAIKTQRQAPQPAEDQFEDPLVRELSDIKRQNQELAEWKQQVSKQQEETALRESVSRHVTFSEQQFAKENPDYFDAVTHLVQSRSAELSIMMPDDDPNVIHMARKAGFQHPSLWREDLIRREAISLGRQAIDNGQNPAALYYNLAKHRGYAPKAAEPAPAPAAPKPQRIEAIRAGQNAPGSLSTGATKAATNSEGFPSLEELADMYVSDPKKAETTFGKMRAAGLLG